MLIGEGPAEKDEVGPEVKELGRVDCWDMVGLVAQDDAAVDEDEGDECGEEGDKRLQGADDLQEALRLCCEFDGTCGDRYDSFGIVCESCKLVFVTQ